MKPDELKTLKTWLKQAVTDGVKGVLEKRRLSSGKFLAPVVDKTPSARRNRDVTSRVWERSYAAFRKRMRHAGQWRSVSEMLMQEVYAGRFNAEMQLQQRRSRRDPAQVEFDFPEFEHIPRQMHVEWDTVEEFLQREDRYQRRANRNRLAAEEMRQVAALVRYQPLEMGMPEAVARATRRAAVPAAAK